MIKENQGQQDAIRITQKQAKILGFLLRLPTNVPLETITKLALQDPNFCDRLMGIIFPRRRPPSISPPLIHQCIRQLGPDRVCRLFLCNSIFKAFANISLPDFQLETFWLDCMRRGFAAQALAEKVNYPNIYEAFITGFASEIGTLLIATRLCHLCPFLYMIRNRLSDHRNDIERIIAGHSHNEEIKRSGLSKLLTPMVLEAILLHHKAFPSKDRLSALTCITYAADKIGDLSQAYPKHIAIENAKESLKLLDLEISLEEIFITAENLSSSLAQDLGLDVPFPKIFSELSNYDRTAKDDLSPWDTLFPLYSERLLDDRSLFFSRIQNFIDNHKPSESFSVLLINIDNFKKINQKYGYPSGDTILKQLSILITKTMRTADFVAHLGGDQFGLLLPQTLEIGAKIAAERIRALIKGANLNLGNIRLQNTVSICGITVEHTYQIKTSNDVLNRLNNTLKEAKLRGKNRVVWSD